MNNPNIVGKRYFFTGGTSGLGKAAVLSMVENGANVVLTSRSEEKSEALRREVAEIGSDMVSRLEFVDCDLSSFHSVVSACDTVVNQYDRLDGIVNNAGVWFFSKEESEDGIEKTLQVNLLAPYVIVHRLKGLLGPESKLIQTASALHQGKLNAKDPEFKKSYSGFRAYRQSKLGIILLTRWWAKEFSEKNIGAYSQHPGLVSTELGRGGNWFVRKFFDWFGKTPEQGAQTLLYLIQTPVDELENGAYYKNENPKETDTAVSKSMEMAEKVDELCHSYTQDYLPE